MKKQDLSQLSTSDLLQKIGDETNALKKLRLSHTVSPVENPLKIRTTRREIARLQTELRKREISEQTKK